jgi:hypothetical protein
VRLVVLGEREAGGKVSSNLDGGGSFSFGLLEVGGNGGVNRFLHGKSLSGDGVGSLLSTELSASSVSLVTVSSSESSISDLGNINSGKRDLGGGGHGVDLVNTLKGDTVDLVGSGDEEETGIKSLEHNDSLSTESSGEEDEDATGFKSGSELRGFLNLSSVGSSDVISGVPLELFDHWFRV